MNLTLDFGNSRVKAGVFSGNKIVMTRTYSRFSAKTLASILEKFPIENAAMASVVKDTLEIEKLLRKRNCFIRLDHSTLLPFKNNYESPRTLGADRLANLVGASSFFPGKNILVMSAGTCITYDVLSADQNYFGGNITPGVDMRLKAMNTFTARLPLVKKTITTGLFGRNTADSMLTGVVKGTALEMQGFISEYRKQYSSLRIVITGGDASLLVSQIQSKIFAVPHLVLYGLNTILLLNNAH